MTDLAQLLAFTAGAAIGAAAALAIAWHRGAFKPVVHVHVAIKAPGETPVAIERQDQQTVVIRPQILVNWDVLYKAAAGAGCVVIPSELAPPLH